MTQMSTSDTPDNNGFPKRNRIRASFHDYSGGNYFVTIRTKDKRHFFGKIRNDEMIHSKIGRHCEQQLKELEKHYPYAEIPLYVVMPDHIHMIVRIDDNAGTHGRCVPVSDWKSMRPYNPGINSHNFTIQTI